MLDQLTSLAGKSYTSIYTIGSEDAVVLNSPISVTIEEFEGEVTATAHEFESVGDGETEPDAIADLKDQLGELFIDLMDTPDEELGRVPKSWKRILSKMVATLD